MTTAGSGAPVASSGVYRVPAMARPLLGKVTSVFTGVSFLRPGGAGLGSVCPRWCHRGADTTVLRFAELTQARVLPTTGVPTTSRVSHLGRHRRTLGLMHEETGAPP